MFKISERREEGYERRVTVCAINGRGFKVRKSRKLCPYVGKGKVDDHRLCEFDDICFFQQDAFEKGEPEVTVRKQYFCNVCGDHIETVNGFLDAAKIGNIAGRARLLNDADDPALEGFREETDVHICWPCYSSIQTMEMRCGAGFAECSGGPNCGSDHK